MKNCSRGDETQRAGPKKKKQTGSDDQKRNSLPGVRVRRFSTRRRPGTNSGAAKLEVFLIDSE